MDSISAFMDGEISQREARKIVLVLQQNDETNYTCKAFHLIGDVMRGEPVLKDDFAARLQARMEQEPPLAMPPLIWRRGTSIALTAAASCSAIALILTLVLSDNPLKPQIPTEVAVSSPAESVQASLVPQRVSAANQVRVNEYLMAHQEFSPSTTLQGVAPYVRTVAATQNTDR
jgi:sigma-E factor negative regulatory protein RseA